MAATTKLYESTFIVNAGLDDPQVDAVIEKAKEAVAKNGGELTDLVKWGRKRFTYPIRKKNNGYYAVFEFKGPSDVVAKLERHYQLDENVLRYITIDVDPKTTKGRIKPSEYLKQPVVEPVTPVAPVAVVEPVPAQPKLL
jgi:small subunit ribosomal protein S6